MAEFERTTTVGVGADAAFDFFADPQRITDYVPTMAHVETIVVDGEESARAGPRRDAATGTRRGSSWTGRRGASSGAAPAPDYAGSITVAQGTASTCQVTVRLHTRDDVDVAGRRADAGRGAPEHPAGRRRALSGRARRPAARRPTALPSGSPAARRRGDVDAAARTLLTRPTACRKVDAPGEPARGTWRATWSRSRSAAAAAASASRCTRATARSPSTPPTARRLGGIRGFAPAARHRPRGPGASVVGQDRRSVRPGRSGPGGGGDRGHPAPDGGRRRSRPGRPPCASWGCGWSRSGRARPTRPARTPAAPRTGSRRTGACSSRTRSRSPRSPRRSPPARCSRRASWSRPRASGRRAPTSARRSWRGPSRHAGTWRWATTPSSRSLCPSRSTRT